MYGWSEKIFLVNSGGSHHFAAAQYIAKRLSIQVPISGRIELNYIDHDGLSVFIKKYSSILIPHTDFCFLDNLFDKSGLNVLFYRSKDVMPADTVMLFYKNGEIPGDIDSMLKNRFTDFNIELMKYYNLQNVNALFQSYL